MNRATPTAAGLFPDLGAAIVGGIEASGRIAVDVLIGLSADPPPGWPPFEVRLVSYGGGFAHGLAPEGSAARALPAGASPIVRARHARTKAGVLLAAAGLPASTRLVLAWHAGLLRVYPLLRTQESVIVVFLHGVEAWRPLGAALNHLARSPRRRVLVLANSQHTWERACVVNPNLAGLAHRIVPLGLGARLPGLLPPPDDPPALLMLGRLAASEDYKGHREVITSWPLVRRGVPGARLWIAGDGDLRPRLQAQAADLGLADSVTFFGRVSEADKANLLLRCRALGLPSRGEGFGLVYTEAMRMGRPCLVSTQDAGREVVNPPRAGLAADPGDRIGLAAAIQRLLRDGPQWQSWSATARRRYELTFTEDAFRQRLRTALVEAGDPLLAPPSAPGA